MDTTKRVRNYKGHTITSCGLSWHIDRTPGKVDGIFCQTLGIAKRKISEMSVCGDSGARTTEMGGR